MVAVPSSRNQTAKARSRPEMLDKHDMVKYNKIKSIPVVSAFTLEKSSYEKCANS
jgi:hypothetical protein